MTTTPSRVIHYIRDQYVSNYDNNYHRLTSMGIIGALTFPLVYIASLIGGQSHVPTLIYIIGCVLPLGITLHRRWPARWFNFFHIYSFITVAYCLPFFYTLNALLNDFSHGWQLALIAIWAVLVVVFNLISYLLVFCTGTIAAIVVDFILFPHLHRYVIHDNFVFAITFLVVALIGVVFAHDTERVSRTRTRTLAIHAAQMAHELRRPLLGISTGFYTLDQNLFSKTKLTDQNREVISLIKTEIEYALELFKFHTFISSPYSINKEDFSLQSILNVVKAACKSYPYRSSYERNNVFCVDEGLPDFKFHGSRTLTIYVLYNLFRNSFDAMIRHNRRGSIYLSTQKTERYNFLNIRDTGPGIPHKHRKKIFKLFWTTATGPGEGTGLGLYFVRNVMRAFNGEVHVDSNENGTEIILRFPAIADGTASSHP